MQGRTVSTDEARRAHRMDREGAPASISAGSAPPANELTSITLLLAAIGRHVTYQVTRARSKFAGPGQLPTQPAGKQREVGVRLRHALFYVALSETVQQLASELRADGCGGSWAAISIIRREL